MVDISQKIFSKILPKQKLGYIKRNITFVAEGQIDNNSVFF